MFRPNDQPGLFSFENVLGKRQRDLLASSKEKWFYTLVLRNINEHDFKPLFSGKASRPNVGVNVLVSALILKELKGLSYDELMESVLFDLRFKAALGLSSLDEVPFARATLFNFQNRLLDYEQQTGINLIEGVFDHLTAGQIKQLALKTDIQRSDSTLVSSNIRKYSRIQLLVEVLMRLERIMEETDKALLGEQVQGYLKTGSEHYVYGLKSGELPRELEKLGKVYHAVHNVMGGKEGYRKQKEFIHFERVYREHFVIVDQQITPKATEDLHSGMLQSPDDPQATYRKKKEQESKGYTINGSETANPVNPLQLVTDIAVNPNNMDDSQILNQRADKMKEKTPELEEMHTDGGYGSQSPDVYTVECPGQKVESRPTKQRHKARFDLNLCSGCPLKEVCSIFKNKGRYYFKHEDYLLNKRQNNLMKIPKERRKLRANVEALMKEFKTRTPGGKAKVRGLFKITLFAFHTGIAINFGRIYRYIRGNDLIRESLSAISLVFRKIGMNIHRLFFKSAIWAGILGNSRLLMKYYLYMLTTTNRNFSDF